MGYSEVSIASMLPPYIVDIPVGVGVGVCQLSLVSVVYHDLLAMKTLHGDFAPKYDDCRRNNA